MTSGNFKTFPLSSIWVDRDKRQRRDIKSDDVSDLAESIGRVGLIHPIVIRRSGELVVGETRFEALKQLGWTDVPVQFIEDLPEDELQMVELEENVRRKDISWQDKCNAIKRYHELHQASDKEWTASKTAAALNFSNEMVSQSISIAQELERGNTMVAAAPKWSTARGIVHRERERRANTIMNGDAPPAEVPLVCADFHEWAATYDGEPFNLIHCDFPYGVNADKHNQGASKSFGGYEDSEKVYFELLATLEASMERIVAESSHLIFWFSMDYYEYTLESLTAIGWKVDPFPLIWYKSDNSGILPDPSRGPRRVYETAFFGHRGDRKIVRAKSNAIAAANIKSVHMSEKPVAVLRHFMEMICDEYSAVLDPTAGSGNAIRVAKDLRAHRYLGLEKDQAIYDAAVAGWRQAEGGDGDG